MNLVSITDRIQSLLGESADRLTAGETLRELASLDPENLRLLLETLAENRVLVSESDPAILGGLLLLAQQWGTSDQAAPRHEQWIHQISPEAVCQILAALPQETRNRHRLLYLLAHSRTPAALRALRDQLRYHPPLRWDEVALVLSPLMMGDDWSKADFFPEVLEGIQHRSVAAPLLDLCNYLTREKRVPMHPAAERREFLARLLGEVVGHLGRFEENPRNFGDSIEEVQGVLDEAVAMAVTLCDALGMIGWDGATGKLFQALQLGHRRVQTEAAGALARLGVEEGREHLMALAAEPVARLRVLAYADELGIAGEINEIYRTDQARAESQMAVWLAQPHQMGVPPTSVEVIDSRLQYWPSFPQPVDCYLVRFEYDLGTRRYTNVGIVGPLVHAMSADLTDFPVDDIYALFAGWHVDHPEIFVIDSGQFNGAQRRLSTSLSDSLSRIGYEAIEPKLLGVCLNESALVAKGSFQQNSYLVLWDGIETIQTLATDQPRALAAMDLWHLYLGRKMLRTFNRDH